MSRFKLYAIFSAMLAAALASKHDGRSRGEITKDINKKSGGILLGGSHMPSSFLNQRQKRKRLRQVPQMRK